MKTLGELTVKKQHESSRVTGELTILPSAVKLGVGAIHHGINKAGLVDILDASGAGNVQGEVQQKLDLFTNEKLKAVLKTRDIVMGIASKKEDETVVLEGCECAKYVVLIDPPDGSPNTDVNVSVGTVFSVYRCATSVSAPVTEEDSLQPGNEQAAVGYMVYGSSTMLAHTTGCGVHAFIYGPSLGVFCSCQERMRLPRKGKTYFINEGNYTKFSSGMKKYIKFCQEEDRSINRPHTLRHIGSLVVNPHRNPPKGGICPYPSVASHPDDKLRSLYKCNSVAFLAEQAGGKAGDDKERTLDITPETLCQRRSSFVGNGHMVEDVERLIYKLPNA